jgi:dienelactone hydrolase
MLGESPMRRESDPNSNVDNPGLAARAPGVGAPERAVTIPAFDRRLAGVLAVPAGSRALVVLPDSGGDEASDPRSEFVARALREAGMATLVLDLLEPGEANDPRKAPDVGLLAGRLLASEDWLRGQGKLGGMPLGLLGEGRGAAAALIASARRPGRIGAIVARSGRPDLAWSDLPGVEAPTLLLVGGEDPQVVELNRRSVARLGGPRELVVIPGATGLFPEPGALEEVARLAADWFRHRLGIEPADRSAEVGERSPHGDMDVEC